MSTINIYDQLGLLDHKGIFWKSSKVSGEMVKQRCPYKADYDYCGEDCPLFHIDETQQFTVVNLCNDRTYFYELFEIEKTYNEKEVEENFEKWLEEKCNLKNTNGKD